MRYICSVCGYVYDEAVEKTPFAELPEDWKCPLCGAPKSEFAPEKASAPKAEPSVQPEEAETLEKLNAGQLAALCSNLARGCDKQYQESAAAQFRKLAEYFTSIVPAQADATVESLSRLLKGDVENYPALRRTADAGTDRGAARVCVWGEKVTRMLSSLVSRYLTEGETMLADTEIWLCTTCGFVYVGAQPPEICPVCKVPSWKFEKIEGRATA